MNGGNSGYRLPSISPISPPPITRQTNRHILSQVEKRSQIMILDYKKCISGSQIRTRRNQIIISQSNRTGPSQIRTRKQITILECMLIDVSNLMIIIQFLSHLSYNLFVAVIFIDNCHIIVLLLLFLSVLVLVLLMYVNHEHSEVLIAMAAFLSLVQQYGYNISVLRLSVDHLLCQTD